jgi:RNA polymerase sigma-70 factor (ECF subfamily)
MGKPKRDFASEAKAAYPALVRAATVLCRSRSDVEDVVQETLMRAVKAYPSFRADSSFLTWAYAILLRAARDANRTRAKGVPADDAANLPEHLPPVERAAMLDEEARRVVDAVRSLPERQREMVTLHFLRELPYSEIAEALGVSVGTVKATMFEAKMSLRAILARKDILHGRSKHVLS